MATKVRGFFAGAFQAFVTSREKQAQRYVNGALLMLDDETLKANGYSRSELSKRPNAYLI
ncbi:hypothetical protein GA830_16570 [Mesorhizobium sp. NBSH29]|uniref:hypothetical protein n=1 Tax=Mesorhizobium sp. NBSH29 TaxID=2654249 RepID=UPI00189642A3|nr:hypothetical protein [Mesorhizobium sp. NBSH29]QPC88188.1 hypothetical protein GA830_16570 [Mesorhizobium sp. NBSH29]